MSKRKNKVMDDVKKQYVRMAIESGNQSFIARKVGITRDTLQKWVHKYRDEVEAEMEQEGAIPLGSSSTPDDIQKKYDHAMKLLGEKELEIALLREMVKKNYPGFKG